MKILKVYGARKGKRHLNAGVLVKKRFYSKNLFRSFEICSLEIYIQGC